jgi:uncharacterized circularly permuted ATP-grasp superfamily protein/uncharacterized alpha-E superfamily protein
MTSATTPADGDVWQLLGYQPLGNAFDEAIATDGSLRPHWRPLIDAMQELGRAELDRRWKQGLDQIRRDGVTFNPYDVESGNSRPWMLDPIPMVFAESEWNQLSSGVQQRARLYEALLTDLFGPQRLLREKVIPPEFYFANPAVYPAYHHLLSPDQRHLSLFASDLARRPDGQWVATGDRTRAPFGLGYVLENRFIASQIFPAFFRRNAIRRIASFYANLRKGLLARAFRSKENPRVVLLTSGPGSRSYFEDAYLARYLGFILVEGGDLAVRNHQVMLKTLGGLLPVEVVFRRADDELCDPVELAGATQSGVAGLVESCRLKNVAVANSIGSRVAESPVLLTRLPEICRFLLSEELQVPSIETWWCGDPSSLEHVLANLDQLLIRQAFRTNADEEPVHPRMLDSIRRQQLIDQIRSRPERYIAQETVLRSTVPVWTEGGAAPWHLAVRVFATLREETTMVLPGGLARIAPNPARLDATMTSGERSQDIWVLAEQPVKEVRLTPLYSEQVQLRRSSPDLPSRVADNLYWLGRYMGRAEGSVRLLREVLRLMSSESDRSENLRPFLRALVDLGQIDPDYVINELGKHLPNVEEVLPACMFDVARDRSLRSSVEQAVRLVSSVPDRINPDMSRVVRRLEELCRLDPQLPIPTVAQSLALLDDLLAILCAFEGLAAECMTRGFGWLFLDLGVRMERAWQLTLLLESTLTHVHQEENLLLESVLQIGGSLMTYRSRYLSNLQVAPVLDLLVCDETNPRSIAYQFHRIQDHLVQIPYKDHYGARTREQQAALSLVSMINLADVVDLSRSQSRQRRVELENLLLKIRDSIPRLSDLISSRYLIHAGLPRTFTGMWG